MRGVLEDSGRGMVLPTRREAAFWGTRRLTYPAPIGSPADWRLHQANGRNILEVRGDWIAQSGRVPAFSAEALRGGLAGEVVAIDSAELGRWDSGLVAFLWDLKRAAATAAW